jgi:hypothetical protein
MLILSFEMSSHQTAKSPIGQRRYKFVFQIFLVELKFKMHFSARNKPSMARSIALRESGGVITAG